MKMFPSQAPIYLTGVLQYTINEVLEGAGVLARLLSAETKTKKSIDPQLLRLVITHDNELNEVFKGAIFGGSGGGGSVSKKHLHSMHFVRSSESESESVVELKKKKKSKGSGRKGGNKSSRAKNGSRDEEDSDDSVVVEETGGSTRGIRDEGHVRRKDKNR